MIEPKISPNTEGKKKKQNMAYFSQEMRDLSNAKTKTSAWNKWLNV